ncbi:peptidylprolyl isomerase [Tropicimonas sp. IMCC34043]|uniref:peptidylprolyl isomerase n=1 Tax=Tropicimonas sp. IMCC34043 TaxID=2248760 RepID=UPI000E23B78E|nr:peptidylprolyl isomerase [Tropicimonas sp. IMCC34043]
MTTIRTTWAAGMVAFTLLGAAPLWAQDIGPDTVVATVGGKAITLGNVYAARATLPAEYQQVDPAMLYSGLVEQLIQQTALAQTLDGSVSPFTELTIDNQRTGLMAADALRKVVDAGVTDEMLKAAYDAKYAAAEPTKEFHAAHILVASEDEAKAIKAELDGGADFAALAKEKSTGPSGPNGGDLGWFSLGMMVPEFETAVVAMEPGQVSDPVQTQFGWHVILLEDTRMAAAPSMDDVRDDLVAEVRDQVIGDALTDVMAKTEVDRPELDIDPAAVLNNPDFLSN